MYFIHKILNVGNRIISGLTFESDALRSCPVCWLCDDDTKTYVNNHPTSDGEKMFVIGEDSSVGKAVSGIFTLPTGIDHVQFLRAGGADAGSGLYVKSIVRNSTLCSAENGENTDTFFEDSCTGLSTFAGEQVFIELLDTQNSGWGKTWIDNIRFQDSSNNNLNSTVDCTGTGANLKK